MTKPGEKQRAVAIINLMVGVLVGAVLVATAQAGREGYFVFAGGCFTGCLVLMGWRIHRVFQIIE